MNDLDIPAAAKFAHPIHNGRAHDPRRHKNNITRMLTDWRSITSLRDDLVREAVAAGISTHEIHRITGIARTTIARIVASASEGSHT